MGVVAVVKITEESPYFSGGSMSSISDTFAIHGGYLGIIVSSIFVIAIILFLLFVGTVGYMIGDTINEVYKDYKVKVNKISGLENKVKI